MANIIFRIRHPVSRVDSLEKIKNHFGFLKNNTHKHVVDLNNKWFKNLEKDECFLSFQLNFVPRIYYLHGKVKVNKNFVVLEGSISTTSSRVEMRISELLKHRLKKVLC